MLIDCTTKGCMQKTEAKLDPATGEVICEACGNPIKGLTKFTTKLLKDIGQILRNNEKRPFQALCKTCNTTRSLYVDESDRTFCKVCNSQVQITASFLKGLKDFISKDKKEEE